MLNVEQAAQRTVARIFVAWELDQRRAQGVRIISAESVISCLSLTTMEVSLSCVYSATYPLSSMIVRLYHITPRCHSR